MGIKLNWLGLTLIVATPTWNPANIPAVKIVGAVLMVIGCALMLLDK